MPGKKESEEQRREQILSAAYKVALREHLEELTMRQVAEEAQLSSGSVFFHFKSKDALLLDLLDWFINDINEEWQIPPELTPRQKVVWLLQQELKDVYHDSGVASKLGLFLSYWALGLHNPEIKGKLIQGIKKVKRLLGEVAQELIESEPTQFKGVTAESIVNVIFSLIQGQALQVLLGKTEMKPDEIFKALEALFGDKAKAALDKA